MCPNIYQKWQEKARNTVKEEKIKDQNCNYPVIFAGNQFVPDVPIEPKPITANDILKEKYGELEKENVTVTPKKKTPEKPMQEPPASQIITDFNKEMKEEEEQEKREFEKANEQMKHFFTEHALKAIEDGLDCHIDDPDLLSSKKAL